MTDPFAEYEAERLAALEAELVAYDSPQAVAARAAKRQAEHEKGVRLGWWDADGNSLTPETDDDDSDEGEDEDEDDQ
jgi:hypothetical protein